MAIKAIGEYTISVISDGAAGAPGATGPAGATIKSSVEQFRLSTSETELVGNYQWSDKEPDTIPDGCYLWGRNKFTMSDGKTVYSNAVHRSTIEGIKNEVDSVNKKISDKIWSTDIESQIDAYDETTTSKIRDRVSSTEQDLDGIMSHVLDISTTVVDGQTTYTSQKLSTMEQNVETFKTTVSKTYATKSYADQSEADAKSYADGLNSAMDERMDSAESTISQNADNIALMVSVNDETSALTLTQNMLTAMTSQFIIKDPKGSATIISGGKIHANAITTDMLAADAIKSKNYAPVKNSNGTTDTTSPYSSAGTYLDLTNGNFYTPNFGVQGTGGAYINGDVFATSGQFGQADIGSYWKVETIYDYNLQPHAALYGVGDPYIQSGYWQLNDNKINTQSYVTNAQSSGKLQYYKDTTTNTYYDVGMKIPTNFSGYSADDSNAIVYQKSFYYGRKYTGNTAPTYDSDWTYFFQVDTDGNIYEGGVKLSEKYASIDGVSGDYLPRKGGTIEGNLTVTGTLTATASKATKLATGRNIQANLSSTSATEFDGTKDIFIGVSGTLGVGHGGTGQTSAKNAANAFLNALDTGSSTPTDADYYISQYVNGGTSTTTYHRRPMSALWSYINGKISSVLGLTASSYGGNSATATKATKDGSGNVITTTYRRLDDDQFDTINVTDVEAGNLIVTGVGRFTNGLYGDLTGNATSATQVENNLKIQLNGGTTEGTNQFTYNGSAVKNINITKSSIGLGNVENTKLSTWTGSTSLVQTSVGSLGNAAVKTVDTSISSGSTSTNLPTSAAVVNYVSTYVGNQGFVTSSGVTSVRVQATSPVVSSTNTAQTSTLNTTISLADAYGDTKNPYGTKTKNYVLAGPSSGNDATPTFRALVADDIPTLTPTKAGLGNVTNNKQVKGLSSGTTNGHLVTWGSDGYTVADSGIAKTGVATKLTLAGTDYAVSSNAITVTQANLQNAVQSTSLVLMTSEERSKLSSIQVSEGGTIDFSGVTASAPLTATVATDKTVNITHNTSGVTAGTYRSVTVNTYGHVTAGTNPTTLSGYGITDAKIASGVITLGSNTITPLTANSTLNATKLSGTASISTTGNATTATKFSSNRTIALTGDVTGSVSGTGENGWSIATTVGDNSHNHDSSTIVPIATKTYTGWLGTADNNAANDSFYFMKLRPTDYYAQWRIRYRVTATIPNQNNYHATSDVTLYGYGQASSPAYSIFNTIYSTSYRPYYYHNFYRLTSTGYNANLSNAIGLGLRSSNGRNTTGYERTVKIEILETFNCSFELLDSGVKWANWENNTSTNYAGLSEYDGYNNGLKESGDDNDIVTQRAAYTRFTAGSGGMKQYSLIMEDANGTWQSFTTTNGTGTSKTKNLTGFKLGRLYYFNTGSNIAEGAVNGNNIVEERHQLIDIRYSINSGQTLVGYQPLWIVGIMNNGLFYLDDPWWTQTAPTNADGKIYIPLGVVNPESNINDGYRIDFMGWQGAYYFDGTNFIQYVEAAKAVSATKATQDASGNTISSTYAKLSGATFTGAINIANNTWNTIGDDVYLGDINKGGHLGIQGKNANTGIFFTTYGQTSKTVGGAITWDGSKFSITGTIDTSISGNAATATSATKATQDGNGAVISSTYAKLSGATFTGAVNGTSFAASSYITVNSGNSGTAGGLALYGTNPTGYGIAMRQTTNSGKHGYVQGDWAIYSYMTGTSSNVAGRGWILRNTLSGTGVASVNTEGHAVFNGSITVGGNAANTLGMRMEYDATLQCTNFIFN